MSTMTKEIDISSAKKLGIMGSLFLCLFFIPFLGVFAFFAGMSLILMAFNRFSKVFNNDKLFSKFLQAFVPSIILGFAVLIFEIMFGFGFVLSKVYKTGFNEGTFFFLVSLMIFVGVYLVGMFISYNYKKAFYELSKATNHKLFETVGKLMFFGSTLVIFFVGILIVYISYILLLIAFIKLPNKLNHLL